MIGLPGVLESVPAESRPLSAGAFYWCDLRTGQIGFPTGLAVKIGLPGSLMKLVAAAALKEEGLLPSNQTFDCPGSLVVRRKRYTCQKAHGRLDLVQAIGHSCNLFFAQAAEALSPALFIAYARRFGLDKPVAGYDSGPFPASAHTDSRSYVLGLAEDLKPTALQILQLSALIATRGTPPFLHSAEAPQPSAQPIRLDLAQPTWATLDQGMQLACRQGTARQLDPENRLKLAAKTGTAPYGKTFQSWITGYFPCDLPRHAFCARAFEGTSQDKAVPLARQFLFATDWP